VFGLLGIGWSLAWYAWFRDSPRDKVGITEAELREIGPGLAMQPHGLPWAAALRTPAPWRIAAIGASYVYTHEFFQAWLQTYLVKGRGFTEAALVLSSLTYLVGGTANGLGGLAGDWMVRRHGLRDGRRWLGVAGLSAATLFLAVVTVAPSGNLACCSCRAPTAASFSSSPRCARCPWTSAARTSAPSSASWTPPPTPHPHCRPSSLGTW